MTTTDECQSLWLRAPAVLAPHGIGTMLAMMIVGCIINRVDPCHLLASGLLLTAAVWEMTWFTPRRLAMDPDPHRHPGGDGAWPDVRAALHLTFATLPNALRARTQGTALYSLMRNIGFSIGISLVVFLPTRRSCTP